MPPRRRRSSVVTCPGTAAPSHSSGGGRLAFPADRCAEGGHEMTPPGPGCTGLLPETACLRPALGKLETGFHGLMRCQPELRGLMIPVMLRLGSQKATVGLPGFAEPPVVSDGLANANSTSVNSDSLTSRNKNSAF